MRSVCGNRARAEFSTTADPVSGIRFSRGRRSPNGAAPPPVSQQREGQRREHQTTRFLWPHGQAPQRNQEDGAEFVENEDTAAAARNREKLRSWKKPPPDPAASAPQAVAQGEIAPGRAGSAVRNKEMGRPTGNSAQVGIGEPFSFSFMNFLLCFQIPNFMYSNQSHFFYFGFQFSKNQT